ncbi:MAG: ABC transporter permease, partial [Longispora sp.]|nr:ABC transporter permease [Longispora sp. (in: high G+C Gram-positive bacteria)]
MTSPQTVTSRQQSRFRKAGAVYAGLGLFAIVFFGLIKPASNDVTIRFTNSTGLTFPALPVVIVLGVFTLLAGLVLLPGPERVRKLGVLGRFGTMTGVALTSFVGAFVIWAVSLATTDNTILAIDMLYGTLIAALPLI